MGDKRDKKSVSIVCSSTIWAGTEKWALRACECLQDRGWYVTFFVKDPQVFLPHMSRKIPVRTLPFRNEMDLYTVAKLASWFRQHSSYVIPTRVRDYLLAGVAGRLAGSKILLRLGVVRRLRDSYILDKLRYNRLPHALVVNADVIRTGLYKTPWMKQKQISVVRNGVDSPGNVTEERKISLRKELGIPEDHLVITGAGRLAREKRWDWFIKAADKLRNDFPKISFYLLGDGSERDSLKELVSISELGNQFHLKGFVSNVDDWIDASDIVTLPSRNEGVPNFLLEALGRAKCVVATSSGGTSEIFRNQKQLLLTDTDDFQQYVAFLHEASGNRNLRERLGTAGLQTIRDEFSWTGMVSQLENLLLDL